MHNWTLNLCCVCFFFNLKLKIYCSTSVPRKDVHEITSDTAPKPDALLKQGKGNLGINYSQFKN